MNHLNGQSLNIEDKNIEKLVELFPEVNTDGKIDFEKLKQILGEYVDDSEERYRFVWNGKGEALRLSQTPSMGTLRPAKEEGESKNWYETENLYIEGDNLEVLKLLQKSYFNKVKMIYIDPPYNTGNDFLYKDDYKENIQYYKRITGQVDGEGNAITTNREYSGRFHTEWLNMMYPRLRLARNLLKSNGIIFISIDDTEYSNLKKICDEIFGERNFYTTITWNSTTKAMNAGTAKYKLQKSIEYILVYGKEPMVSTDSFNLNVKSTREYPFANDHGENYRLQEIQQRKNIGIKKSERMVFPILGIMPQDNYRWTIGEETARMLEQNNYVEIINGKVMRKIFKEEEDNVSYEPLWSNFQSEVGTSETGKRRVADLLEYEVDFETIKPVQLIQKLLFHFTNENDIIVDFFSGTATTADAIIQQQIKDGANRRFILVQLPEVVDQSTETWQAGYKNISEIGKERIRRSGEKAKAELIEKYEAATDEERKEMKHPEELDIGFKVFKLDSSNIKEWNPGQYEDIQTAIEDFATPYVPGRTEEDVVYEMMLKMGLDLTYPVEEIDVNGKTIYSIGYGFLMICLADKVDIAVAEKMIEIKEENNQQEFRAIFRDEGFSSDTDKTNVKETLRSAGLAEESFITL
jgi:adenine-specific DNA-methyltransferase